MVSLSLFLALNSRNFHSPPMSWFLCAVESTAYGSSTSVQKGMLFAAMFRVLSALLSCCFFRNCLPPPSSEVNDQRGVKSKRKWARQLTQTPLSLASWSHCSSRVHVCICLHRSRLVVSHHVWAEVYHNGSDVVDHRAQLLPAPPRRGGQHRGCVLHVPWCRRVGGSRAREVLRLDRAQGAGGGG